MKTNILLKLLIPLMVLSMISCGESGLGSDANLFSPYEDQEMGKEFDDYILDNPSEFPILQSAAAVKYVQDIVESIIESPLIIYKDVFPYEVRIINDDETVNAFALPGGYIYVYTGMLKYIDNEAVLAGILAHEIAHADLRHGTESLTKAYGVEILKEILSGVAGSNQMAQLGADIMADMTLLYNSRDNEYEADEYSFKYLQTSKWYPGAINSFFEKISADMSSSLFGDFLSTHPEPDARIEKIEYMLKENNIGQPTESNLFTQRYTNFKNTLP